MKMSLSLLNLDLNKKNRIPYFLDWVIMGGVRIILCSLKSSGNSFSKFDPLIVTGKLYVLILGKNLKIYSAYLRPSGI